MADAYRKNISTPRARLVPGDEDPRSGVYGTLQNLSAADTLYIGGEGVTAATGYPVPPGASEPFEIGRDKELWAITDGNVVNVAVLWDVSA